MLTLLELSDVNGKPKVLMDLPSPLRLGEHLRLAFCLRRQNGGRSEVLDVGGEFKVMAVGIDLAQRPHRQLLSVEAAHTTPHWKAVRKQPELKRVLAPAKAPRRTIE